MYYKLLIGLLFLFGQQQLYGQVTKQFDDQNGRTNIVKESNADDLQILEQNFSDAEVGKVVRIGLEKPKKEKPEKEPTTKPEPKPKPTPPAIEKPQRKSVSSGGSSSSSQTSRKRKKRRFYKLKKRRKTPRRKKWSCYEF